MKNLTLQEILGTKMLKLWSCRDCQRLFIVEIIESTDHWSKETVKPEGPTYCPCCGCFDNIQHHHEGEHK